MAFVEVLDDEATQAYWAEAEQTVAAANAVVNEEELPVDELPLPTQEMVDEQPDGSPQPSDQFDSQQPPVSSVGLFPALFGN